jgi:hypothetical protein
MDTSQNNCGTTGQYTPMMFLGKQQYALDTPVYPWLENHCACAWLGLGFGGSIR